MNIRQTKEVLKIVAIKHKLSVMLWGKHASGKSQSVKQLVNELSEETKNEWGFVDLRLAQMEVGDILGLPIEKDGRTCWSAPEWWPREGTYGIILLDELNRARPDVVQAIFQLALDRRIHSHLLPDTWAIISACNPSDQDYIVNEFDPALMSRFIHIKTIASFSEYIEFGYKNKFNVKVMDFIQKYPQLVDSMNPDINLNVKPDYRNIEKMAIILDDFEKDEILPELCISILGHEAGTAFFHDLNSKEDIIRANEIFHEKFDNTKERMEKLISKNRYDILNIANEELAYKIKEGIDIKSNGHIPNLEKWITNLPNEMAYAFLQKIYSYDYVFDKLIKNEAIVSKISISTK